MPLADESLLREIVRALSPHLLELNEANADRYNIKTLTFVAMHPDIAKCEQCEPHAVSCQRCVLAIYEKDNNELNDTP